MHFAPAAPLAAASTGFGFDEIMRSPDYTRFPTWYARSSYLAPGRGPAVEAAARAAGTAGIKAAPCFDLEEAA
jgi:hypothetical protein